VISGLLAATACGRGGLHHYAACPACRESSRIQEAGCLPNKRGLAFLILPERSVLSMTSTLIYHRLVHADVLGLAAVSRTIVNTKAAPKVASSCTYWWHNVPEFGPNSVPRKRARFICHFCIWSPKRAHFLGTELGPRKPTKSEQIFTPGRDKKTALGPLFCIREMIRRQALQHGRPAPRTRTRTWAAPWPTCATAAQAAERKYASNFASRRARERPLHNAGACL